LGALLHEAGLDEEMAMTSMIFVCGGIGLVIGFYLNRKLDKED
jgi:hypothetical protein